MRPRGIMTMLMKEVRGTFELEVAGFGWVSGCWEGEFGGFVLCWFLWFGGVRGVANRSWCGDRVCRPTTGGPSQVGWRP